MNDLRKAAEEAIEALGRHATDESPEGWIAIDAIRKLREALAHPVKAEQEPVAWISNADFVKGQYVEGRPRRVWWECEIGVGQPLYTAPPKREWVGLTEDEINQFVCQWFGEDYNTLEDLICAIEAKLKEKRNEQ